MVNIGKIVSQVSVAADTEAKIRAKVAAAKKAYIVDLIAKGIDPEFAKVFADVNFKYGLVKPL